MSESQMTLDGKPVTLQELERQKHQLTESHGKDASASAPQRIVEVSPNTFVTKTILRG